MSRHVRVSRLLVSSCMLLCCSPSVNKYMTLCDIFRRQHSCFGIESHVYRAERLIVRTHQMSESENIEWEHQRRFT